MRLRNVVSRGLLVLLAVLAVFVTLIFLHACASMGDESSLRSSSEDSRDNSGSRMQPSADMDVKTAGGDVNSGYDSRYREQSRNPSGHRGATPASGAQGEEVAGAEAGGMIAGILGEQGLANQVASWLIPTAYAADHGIDERYLIREGSCNLLVEDYKKASKKIDSIAQENGGMVSDSRSEKRGDGTFEGYITIRVPSGKFFAAWNAVREVGDLRDERVTTEDASQEYVTQHSRLRNLIAEREVLEAMLADAQQIQRTQGLKEGYDYLLKTQERLFAVSGSIASTENELNALAEKIVQSTITVSMQEKAVTLPKKVETAKTEFRWDLGLTAGEAYQQLLVNVRGFLKGLIWFLITCWTWLIPLALFILAGRFIYMKWIKPTIPAQPAVSAAGDSGKDQ